jgi:hypothetical protein
MMIGEFDKAIEEIAQEYRKVGWKVVIETRGGQWFGPYKHTVMEFKE